MISGHCHSRSNIVEELLRSSEEQLGRFKFGIWEWDAEAGTIHADVAHQLIIGLPPRGEPIPAEVYSARVVGEKIGMEPALLALQLRANFEREQRIVRPTGEVIWILSRGRARPDARRMVGITWDITEKRRLELQLRDNDLQGNTFLAYNPAFECKVPLSTDGGNPQLSEGSAERASNRFPGLDLLTSRERSALAQIVRGASNKEAARILGVSPRTVEFHRANILRKLGARNTIDLLVRVLAPGNELGQY